jgi:hypothetical protein
MRQKRDSLDEIIHRKSKHEPPFPSQVALVIAQDVDRRYSAGGVGGANGVPLLWPSRSFTLLYGSPSCMDDFPYWAAAAAFGQNVLKPTSNDCKRHYTRSGSDWTKARRNDEHDRRKTSAQSTLARRFGGYAWIICVIVKHNTVPHHLLVLLRSHSIKPCRTTFVSCNVSRAKSVGGCCRRGYSSGCCTLCVTSPGRTCQRRDSRGNRPYSGREAPW